MLRYLVKMMICCLFGEKLQSKVEACGRGSGKQLSNTERRSSAAASASSAAKSRTALLAI